MKESFGHKYFNTRKPISKKELEHHVRLGKKQLAKQKNKALSPSEETKQCEEFVKQAKEIPQFVMTRKNVIPSKIGIQGYIYDFYPNKYDGKSEDDIYAKHHEIWDKLTRGCTIIELTSANKKKHRMMWGIRANHKFTGMETSGIKDTSIFGLKKKKKIKDIFIKIKEEGKV